MKKFIFTLISVILLGLLILLGINGYYFIKAQNLSKTHNNLYDKSTIENIKFNQTQNDTLIKSKDFSFNNPWSNSKYTYEKRGVAEIYTFDNENKITFAALQKRTPLELEEDTTTTKLYSLLNLDKNDSRYDFIKTLFDYTPDDIKLFSDTKRIFEILGVKTLFPNVKDYRLCNNEKIDIVLERRSPSIYYFDLISENNYALFFVEGKNITDKDINKIMESLVIS